MRASTHRARRNQPTSRTFLTAAVVFTILLLLITYAAFVRGLPVEHPFEIRAVFNDVDQLKRGDEVRMGGIKIGSVSDVRLGAHDTAVATFDLSQHVPLFVDATASIRPRLVLEGNDYVILSPGSPEEAPLPSGGTIPLADTNEEVQLDQVLSSLTLPVRTALSASARNLARGLGHGSSPSNPPGSQGLRTAARQLDESLDSFTTVVNAAQGTGPADLSRAIGSTGSLTDQIATDPAALGDLVTSYDRVMGALAEQGEALQQSVSGSDGLLRQAPGDLTAIDPALPRLTRFANDLRPTLRSAPQPLHDFDGLLGQLGGLARRSELPELLRNLRPLTTALPTLEGQLTSLFPLVNSAMGCVSRNVVGTLDMEAPDPATPTGDPIWLDALHAFAGYAGLASDFDGNGNTVRLGVTEGEQTLAGAIPGIGQVVGVGPEGQGTDPVWLGYGVNPPWRPDQPCADQPLPNLGADDGGVLNNVVASPLTAPTGEEAKLVKGLSGTTQDRLNLLANLLSGLGLTAHAASRHGSASTAPSHQAHPPVGHGPAASPAPPGGASPAPSRPTLGSGLSSLLGHLPALLGGSPSSGSSRPAPTSPSGAVGSILNKLGLGGGH